MLANSNPSVQKCGKCIVWSLPLHILVIHGSHEQEQPVVQSEPTCEEEAARLDFPEAPLCRCPYFLGSFKLGYGVELCLLEVQQQKAVHLDV